MSTTRTGKTYNKQGNPVVKSSRRPMKMKRIKVSKLAPLPSPLTLRSSIGKQGNARRAIITRSHGQPAVIADIDRVHRYKRVCNLTTNDSVEKMCDDVAPHVTPATPSKKARTLESAHESDRLLANEPHDRQTPPETVLTIATTFKNFKTVISEFTEMLEEYTSLVSSSVSEDLTPRRSLTTFERRKIEHLDEKLASFGSSPMDASLTGTVMHIVQSIFRTNLHSTLMDRLVDRSLWDSALSVYLLLAEGKLRALQNNPHNSSTEPFKILGLGRWSTLRTRLSELFRFLGQAEDGLLECDGTSAAPRFHLRPSTRDCPHNHYRDTAGEVKALAAAEVNEVQLKPALASIDGLVLGVRVLNLWCEYIRFVSDNVLTQPNIQAKESVHEITGVIRESKEFAEQVRSAADSFQFGERGNRAVAKINEFGAALSALQIRHFAPIPSAFAMTLPNDVSFPHQMSQNLQTAATLITAVLTRWKGNLQSESLLSDMLSEIVCILDAFEMNVLVFTQQHTDLAALDSSASVQRRLTALNRVYVALLRKMKLKLFAMEPTVQSEVVRSSASTTSIAAVALVLQPLRGLVARVDAQLVALPCKTPRDADAALLEIVQALEYRDAMNLSLGDG